MIDYNIEHFDKFNDARGQLVVFLKNSDLTPELKKFGQIYFVTFEKQGVVRGNHYHKKWREWFGVVYGKLNVKLKNMITQETKELMLDGDSTSYVRLEIGPNIAHSFKSISSKAALVNYANEEWTPDDTFSITLME